MKFTIARTGQQRSHLDQLFESYSITRDRRTGETVFTWRPVRFLTLVAGLPTFGYMIALLALTWWMQMLAPGFPVKYTEVLNPLQWLQLANDWSNYRHDTDQPQIVSPTKYALKAPDIGPAAKTKAVTVEASRVSSLQGSAVYGPLLEQFFKRNGGMDKLTSIYSIQVHGIVTAADAKASVFSFTMMKKPPSQVRLSMKNEGDGTEGTVLTDGKETWKWIGNSPENAVVNTAGPNDVANLTHEAMWSDVAVEILRSPRVLRELPRQASSDESYDIVEMLLPHDVGARIYLDPETSRAVRLDLTFDQNGAPHLYTIFVHDWMDIEGVPEPKSLTVFSDGGKVLDCVFDKITFNQGAYDSLFQRPVVTSPAAAPAGAAAASTPPTASPAATSPAAGK